MSDFYGRDDVAGALEFQRQAVGEILEGSVLVIRDFAVDFLPLLTWEVFLPAPVISKP